MKDMIFTFHEEGKQIINTKQRKPNKRAKLVLDQDISQRQSFFLGCFLISSPLQLVEVLPVQNLTFWFSDDTLFIEGIFANILPKKSYNEGPD
jgi:hypothetical protein